MKYCLLKNKLFAIDYGFRWLLFFFNSPSIVFLTLLKARFKRLTCSDNTDGVWNKSCWCCAARQASGISSVINEFLLNTLLYVEGVKFCKNLSDFLAVLSLT